jgi:hypothetical protein
MDEQTKDVHRLQALNMAIWIRDNSTKVNKDLLIERMQEISEYGLFSNRQIANISGNTVRNTTLSAYIQKKDKSGGKINPKNLEDIRDLLFSRNRGHINYPTLFFILDNGTSQNMVSKLTGINQSTISRKYGERTGAIKTSIEEK